MLLFLTYIYLKDFWEISCFYQLSFLRYFQSLKPITQIPTNFYAKIGKIELLINFREKNENKILKEETTDVNILLMVS